jgi:hypothetical protein
LVNAANAVVAEDEADDEVAEEEAEDDGDGATVSDEPRMTGIRVGDKSGGGKCDNDDEDEDAAEDGGSDTRTLGV